MHDDRQCVLQPVIRDDYFNAHLRQKVDGVSAAAVKLRAALLPAVSTDRFCGHAYKAGFFQSRLDLLELAGSHNRVDFFQQIDCATTSIIEVQMPQEKPDVRAILPIDVEEKKKKPKAKREDGKTAEESIRLGDERLAEGEVNDAIHHYRRALKMDDTSVETRLRLADSYDLAELGPQAAAQYEKLLKTKKQRPEAHVGLADVYRRYGKHRAGILRLKKACQLNPGNAFYWYRLAEAIVAAGVPEDAAVPAARAFDAEPNDPFYGVWLGRLLLKLSRPTEAVKPLEAATRLNASDHDAWFLLAAAYAAARQKDKAVRSMTRAGDLDPDSLLYKACRIALEGGEEKVIMSAYDQPTFVKWLSWAGIA